jgi:hypothetical protein
VIYDLRFMIYDSSRVTGIAFGGWQRQAESSELADGTGVYAGAIGKLRLPLPPTNLGPPEYYGWRLEKS